MLSKKEQLKQGPMNRCVVLMASHLGSKERYQTIKWAIESIAQQTRKPDKVMISYSFALDSPDTDQWSTLLENIPYMFIQHHQKQSQFQHYFYLFKHITNEDIVMFLDDDDLFAPNKVEIVENIFKTHPNYNVICHEVFNFGDPFSTSLTLPQHIHLYKGSYGMKEYFVYCIKGYYIFHVIEKINDSFELSYSFFDVLFSSLLNEDFLIEKALQYVRLDRIQRDY